MTKKGKGKEKEKPMPRLTMKRLWRQIEDLEGRYAEIIRARRESHPEGTLQVVTDGERFSVERWDDYPSDPFDPISNRGAFRWRRVLAGRYRSYKAAKRAIRKAYGEYGARSLLLPRMWRPV